MKTKILKNMSLLLAVSILLTFALMTFLIYGQEHNQMKQGVKNEAGYVKLAIDKAGRQYLDSAVGRVTSSRITLVSPSGQVVYDSAEDPATLDNHAKRPEVLEAENIGAGESTRLSATLGEMTYYYAMRLDDGSIVRVARTTDSIFATIKNSVAPLLLIFIAVMAIAVVLTRIMTKRMIQPLNELDLEHPLENDVYEELAPLLTRINKQKEQIQEQVEVLKEKQEEYEAITENMKDGLVVTSRTEILSMNKAAARLFHARKEDCIHKNMITLSRNEKVKECLDKALGGRPSNRGISMDGREYQLLGNPVRVDGQVQGAVLFILDVTEKAKSEQMRREFSANVSHELKTPLMSISGYAELLMNQMVRPEDIPEFTGRIYREATRLSTLVSDIIKLSRLDEEDQNMSVEEVDLWSLASDAAWHLQQKAAERGIRIKVEGEPLKVKGNPQVLEEVIFNLCDNAVKYNKDGGGVTIRITRENEETLLTVTDTGVGIAAEEQQRIFERFYRVDKSRSREIEGTGLGLSIVKHGAMLHDARIQVESTPGKGSEISVIFPS